VTTIYQGALSDVLQELSEPEESFSQFAGLPQSTPQKSQTAKFKVPLPVQLTTSGQISTCTKPCIALAPTWTQQSVG